MAGIALELVVIISISLLLFAASGELYLIVHNIEGTMLRSKKVSQVHYFYVFIY